MPFYLSWGEPAVVIELKSVLKKNDLNKSPELPVIIKVKGFNALSC